MNYQIFTQMEEGIYAKGAAETEQKYMERILRAVCEKRTDGEITCLIDLMAPELESCNVEEQTLCLKFEAKPWQKNPNGTLHGGMIAAAVDITFGMLVRFYTRIGKAVTLDLDISYMRPIQIEDAYLIQAKIKKDGRRVKFLHGDVMLASTGKLAAEATARFM